jgi:hypothetical protein
MSCLPFFFLIVSGNRQATMTMIDPMIDKIHEILSKSRVVRISPRGERASLLCGWVHVTLREKEEMKELSSLTISFVMALTIPWRCHGSLIPSFLRLFSTTLPLSWSSNPLDRFSNGNENHSEKLGIILLNLGGPEKQEDVQGFLYNLFADPDIIRLPKFPCPLAALQKPIAYFISRNRAPKSKAAYQSIGGGSPINMHTKEQAKAIEMSLAKRGIDAKCYIGMRYWSPYTTEVRSFIF